MLSGSILQKLSEAHDPRYSSKRSLSFGVYYKNTLVSLCHALEDCILNCDSAPLVMTAFQRGKWYLEEADRYRLLAAQARQVVIMACPDAGFAEHPTGQQPNVHLVALHPDDPVAQEWHLIILAPTYAAMVLCQELSPAEYGAAGVPPEDLSRKFYGFWTFEPNLVAEVMELAIAHVGQYNPSLQAQLSQHVDAIQQEARSAPALEPVVAQVVAYLQQNQQTLGVDPHRLPLDDNLLSNELQAFLRMAQLMDALAPENPKASQEVAALAEMLGQLIDLPAWQLKRLRLAGLLHRLAPLQGAESLFDPPVPSPTPDYPACPLTCALEPGAQVLRTMPRLRAIAQILTHQTEWWNGTGTPTGLRADAIPVESRILALAIHFQALVGSLAVPSSPVEKTSWLERLQAALAHCQHQAGDRWDPKLVELLTLLVSGFHQGMALTVQAPKLTNGLWLLDALPMEPDGRSQPVLKLEAHYGS